MTMREGAGQGLGVGRVLEHQRTLQIAGAVKPGGQSKVAFEQGARSPKQLQDVVVGHGKRPETARTVPRRGTGPWWPNG